MTNERVKGRLGSLRLVRQPVLEKEKFWIQIPLHHLIIKLALHPTRGETIRQLHTL